MAPSDPKVFQVLVPGPASTSPRATENQARSPVLPPQSRAFALRILPTSTPSSFLCKVHQLSNVKSLLADILKITPFWYGRITRARQPGGMLGSGVFWAGRRCFSHALSTATVVCTIPVQDHIRRQPSVERKPSQSHSELKSHGQPTATERGRVGFPLGGEPR